MRAGSGTLLIAFGGMQGQLGMPPFEFFKATGSMPVKKLFVRDLRQAWYHRGIPGHGEGIDGVAAALKQITRAHGARRLVCAGNSAGGYAALLFGTLLEADVVLCFAPQTVIELGALAEMEDHRWDEQLHALQGALDARYTDLARALPAAGRGATAYELYFDDTFATDRRHAERLGALDGLRLHRLQGGAHGVVREMREAGELDRVLQEALRTRAAAS
jgi:pimeloyl-ACP methyl ester carboxylesterase